MEPKRSASVVITVTSVGARLVRFVSFIEVMPG
jgi:hypothetical protein